MKILLIWSIIILLLFFGFFIFIFDFNNEDNEEERFFQGPVQEGYDQEHFWRTGETKLIKVVK